ncbi:hypothetical protein [Methanosarcina vacuolata]|uniref:hypothetical protein n=1 Tax=Methanosarcina vacuolata TaxID=2215 RepID=UPI0012F6AE23|nr:hypothetical protein [Methanosarcina vacuolata]
MTVSTNTINKSQPLVLFLGVPMRKLLIILLFLIIFTSGCASKETKYVRSGEDQEYVTLASDGTAFYHTGGLENYKGTWKEVEGQYGENEITLFLDDGSSLVFRQKQNDKGTLLLKVPVENGNGGVEKFYKED